MKLLTAIVSPSHVERVAADLDGAGLTVTTVASAQASGMESGRRLQYKGVSYTDRRCVRLEVLVDDVDLDLAVALVAPAGEERDDGVVVWVSDVDCRRTLRPLADPRQLVSLT